MALLVRGLSEHHKTFTTNKQSKEMCNMSFSTTEPRSNINVIDNWNDVKSVLSKCSKPFVRPIKPEVDFWGDF
jgi:hypothetical protein